MWNITCSVANLIRHYFKDKHQGIRHHLGCLHPISECLDAVTENSRIQTLVNACLGRQQVMAQAVGSAIHIGELHQNPSSCLRSGPAFSGFWGINKWMGVVCVCLCVCPVFLFLQFNFLLLLVDSHVWIPFELNDVPFLSLCNLPSPFVTLFIF